jgi:hypothetical protein
MRACDNVDGDDLADFSTGFGARVNGGANGGDIAANGDRYEAAADFVLLDELDVGGFQRRIQRFDCRDDSFGFDQSDCF